MNDNLAKVASEVVNGLKASPVLLALLVLNAMGVGASLWFLTKLAAAQSSRFDVLLRHCLKATGGAP